MEAIREYMITVTAAALICGVLNALASKLGSSGKLLRLMCGILMLLTVISPLTKIRLTDLPELGQGILESGEALATAGENSAREEMAAIIKEQTQAYILDKANVLGASLEVEVILTEDTLPVPKSVRLQGAISPYGKGKLQQILAQDLGIPTEEQIWIS